MLTPETLREQFIRYIFKFIKDFDNESHEYPMTLLSDRLIALVLAKVEESKLNGEEIKDALSKLRPEPLGDIISLTRCAVVSAKAQLEAIIKAIGGTHEIL